MVLPRHAIFQDRKHAANLLAERLREYRHTDAVIVAVSGGGIEVALPVAQALELPIEVIPCRKLKHPADEDKTIGAVSAGAVVIHEDGNDIPQDYLYHQIQLLQHAIQGQLKRLGSGDLQGAVANKLVILIDDVLMTGDSVLACIRSLRRFVPAEIVLAVPIVTPEGARAVADDVDSVIYLSIEAQPVGKLYSEFPDVSDEQVIALMHRASN
jgi:putative phosphoribosyl transferase